MTELPPNQRIVRLNQEILAAHGIELDHTSQILDFCCGSGRHVYEYLDSGYQNTHGYDIRNYVELREHNDLDRFRFGPQATVTHIPFPDDFFEFVYSTSVFEHVQNQSLAFQEINRVLKPGAWSLHNFPAKWRPIEPHIFVPFGGTLKARWWYALWTRLGVRAAVLEDRTVQEAIDIIYEYGQNGLKYLSGREISGMLEGIFSEVKQVEADFIRHSEGRSRILAPLVPLLPGLTKLFRCFHTRVLLLRKTEKF